MTKINYSQVKKINGKKVVNAGLSSEHTQYFGENKNYGKFFGYCWFEDEDGKDWYIPTDLKGNLVLDLSIWNFISELPSKIN